jgi:hypothetical protein
MILNIILAIVAVLASTGLFTWALVGGIRSSMSEDIRVRRRFRIFEVLTSGAVALLCAARADNPKEQKLALAVIAVIIAAWIFRGARLLLAKGKA